MHQFELYEVKITWLKQRGNHVVLIGKHINNARSSHNIAKLRIRVQKILLVGIIFIDYTMYDVKFIYMYHNKKYMQALTLIDRHQRRRVILS